MTKARCYCPQCGKGYVPPYMGFGIFRAEAVHATPRVCWECHAQEEKECWMGGRIPLGACVALVRRS